MRLTPCERNRSLYLRTAYLLPSRHHIRIDFTDSKPQHIHITMPRQAVIITRTDRGHEVISDTLRCVKLGQSEYECHLFLHKYSYQYRLYNTTSKIGQKILSRVSVEGSIHLS